MTGDYTTNSHYLTYTFLFRRLGECNFLILEMKEMTLFNPFTPESDLSQISPAASPEIVHHTVWRNWLLVAYSYERWLHHQCSLPYRRIHTACRLVIIGLTCLPFLEDLVASDVLVALPRFVPKNAHGRRPQDARAHVLRSEIWGEASMRVV